MEDIWASGECPISVIPLNVCTTKYGNLIETLASVGFAQAHPNKWWKHFYYEEDQQLI